MDLERSFVQLKFGNAFRQLIKARFQLIDFLQLRAHLLFNQVLHMAVRRVPVLVKLKPALSRTEDVINACRPEHLRTVSTPTCYRLRAGGGRFLRKLNHLTDSFQRRRIYQRGRMAVRLRASFTFPNMRHSHTIP